MKLQVNAPIIEALTGTPDYTNHLEDLPSSKSKIGEDSKVTMDERYSAILQNAKEKHLGSFTLPCTIGSISFDNAFTDLRASVSVMPYSTFTKLN